MPAAAARVVCLGEALVDFVADGAAAEVSGAELFRPRFGGSPANIAVAAARFGARAALLGGAGDDAWGRWLRAALAREEVDTRAFTLLAGVPTPHTFVAHGEGGEPSYAFFADGRERCVASADGHLDRALAGPPGVFVFGSDTLIGARERAVTLRARALARERGWTILYDPNLRPVRWPDPKAMHAAAQAALAGATVVKANEHEARALTGEADTAAAAARLAALAGEGRRPAAAVVTRGAQGIALALAPDGRRAEAAPVPARPVDTTGAGDAVAGVLAAALAAGAAPGRLEPVLALAARTAARVTEAPGATTALPPRAAARAALAEAIGAREGA